MGIQGVPRLCARGNRKLIHLRGKLDTDVCALGVVDEIPGVLRKLLHQALVDGEQLDVVEDELVWVLRIQDKAKLLQNLTLRPNQTILQTGVTL